MTPADPALASIIANVSKAPNTTPMIVRKIATLNLAVLFTILTRSAMRWVRSAFGRFFFYKTPHVVPI